jgi:hypothetical protein
VPYALVSSNGDFGRPLLADFVAKVGCCQWIGGYRVKSGRL